LTSVYFYDIILIDQFLSTHSKEKKMKLDDNDLMIEAQYLDYFNNFLTVKGFARYYGFNVDFAERLINLGREINHLRSEV
jgi:hypothetical protein